MANNIAGWSFAILVVLVMILLTLKVRRESFNSALESCFESNRIKAQVHIDIYQKWMVVVFCILVLDLFAFVAACVEMLYRNGYGGCS